MGSQTDQSPRSLGQVGPVGLNDHTEATSDRVRSEFIHLHVHSNFSFMDGAASLDGLIERAVELGMDSLAVTDHQGLYGAIRFYQKAKKAGIKPIIGTEIIVDDGSERGGHLVLLARNRTGYASLCRLLSEAHLDWGRRMGFGGDMEDGIKAKGSRAASAKTATLAARPDTMKVSMDTLRRYPRGLIALSSCPKGEIGRAVTEGRHEHAEEAALRYIDIYGWNGFYIELQNQRLPGSLSYMSGLIDLAKRLRELHREQLRENSGGKGGSGRSRYNGKAAAALPLVVTNNVHYVNREDHKVHDVLVAAGDNTTLPGPVKRPNAELYFKTVEQMRSLLADAPAHVVKDAIENTRRIADACNLDLHLGQFHFPKVPIPEGETHYSILAKETWKGAERRYKVMTPEVVSRIEHELKLVDSMGFSAYFLIVKDIVDFAHSQGIFCSGRGSAGDSIISYCLGITSVDPIKYDLLFERFLNPKRRDMPDIDVDFCSTRRDEVIEYIYRKYGADKVAMVATVNTMNARGAIRVAGKALGVTEEEMSRMTRRFPWVKAGNIRGVIAAYPELADNPLRDEARYGALIDVVEKLDRCPAHLGTHLGGFIITPRPIASMVPLQWAAKGTVVAQYDKDDIEALGLVKMDILGLRTHSAIAETVGRIEKLTGKPLDPYDLPHDDEASYELIRSARNIGLFQLESSGQRNLSKRLLPERFEDIISSISLFRPGPIESDMITPFIRRRHGLERVVTPHPEMKRVLRDTYGVIVYQEQVLSVAAAVAGFDLSEADMLRRAMTKDKSMEEMDRIGAHFVKRAMARGSTEAVASEVFRQLRGFAAYGFNKAHAGCFAVLSYATAWLKAHYPAEFLSSILNNQPMGFYSPRVVLNDARHFGLKILPPDINESSDDFLPICPSAGKRGDAIRVGLKYLKGMSGAELSRIFAERGERQFESFAEFYRRTRVSRPTAENLIRVGAFDSLGSSRDALLSEVEAVHKWMMAHGASREPDLISSSKAAVVAKPRGHSTRPPVDHPSGWSLTRRLKAELDLLGLNISCHPLYPHREDIASLRLTPSSQIPSLPDRSKIRVIGLRERSQTPMTKSKKRTAFLTLEDEEGLLDVVVFERTLAEYGAVISRSRCYVIEGTLQNNEERGITIVADRIEPFTPLGRSDGKGIAGNSSPGLPRG